MKNKLIIWGITIFTCLFLIALYFYYSELSKVPAKPVKFLVKDHSKDYKILILGGHTAAGLKDTGRGAKSYSGKWENEFNDAIVNLFANTKNQLAGVEYILAPTTENLSLQAKVELAKKIKPDLYIEIHHDSGSQDDIDKAKSEGITSPLWKSMSGFCVLYYDDGDGKESKFPKESRKFAELLSEEMIKINNFHPDSYHAIKQGIQVTKENKGLYNRIKPKSLFVLRNAISPAVVLECGYIINPIDEKILSTPEFQEKIVWAINNAIEKFRLTLADEQKVKAEANSLSLFLKK
jgi:N-acetylmuramoyl-L-alanine amidase